MENKNESEKIFEQYLDLNGFKDKWNYEPLISGKNTRIDYLLDINGEKYFFEVKELRKKPDEPNEHSEFIDPYSSLRKEITEVRKQFKYYKEYSCSLVVFNIDDRTFRSNPFFIFGAMLGNLGLTADYAPVKGELVAGSERNKFLDGGRMIDYKGKCKQNTTISSILILEKFLDNIEVERAMSEEMRKYDKEFTGPEFVEVRMKLHKNHEIRRVPRVVVVENPFARIPFPEDLFRGPFDERWRLIKDSGEVKRVFVGNKLKELESLKENKAISKS